MSTKRILITLFLIFAIFATWIPIKNNPIFWIKEHSNDEQEKIRIDEYNFQQIEKIKEAFESNSENKKDINSLWYFVFEYGIDIVPIKNCYYVSNFNWKYNYIIWFKLESDKYIKKYWTEYYAYPDYDIEPMNICDWHSCDNDMNRYEFEWVVNNPCRGTIRWLLYEDRNRDWEYKRFKDSALNWCSRIFIDLNNDWLYWNYEPRSECINNGFTTGYDESIYGNYEFNDLKQWVYTIWVVNSNYWSYIKPQEKKYIVEINNNNLFIKDIDFWVYKDGKFH